MWLIQNEDKYWECVCEERETPSKYAESYLEQELYITEHKVEESRKSIMYKFLYQRKKKTAEKAKRSLRVAKKRNRILQKKISELRKELAGVKREKESLEEGYVVEWCVHCERQITMWWDVWEDGLTAFCPFCGKKVMLCEKCQGECDYDYGVEVCKEM